VKRSAGKQLQWVGHVKITDRTRIPRTASELKFKEKRCGTN
jgi:hypothetical protein